MPTGKLIILNGGSAHAIYDVEIDTTSLPPNMLAQQLVDQLAACPPPTAFATLRTRLA